MADNERQWIVEPPGPGEVALHLSVGDGVELTADQERAISELLHSLESAEVGGFAAKCPKQGSCGTLKCPSMNCSSLSCGTFQDTKLAADAVGGWSLMGTFGGPS